MALTVIYKKCPRCSSASIYELMRIEAGEIGNNEDLAVYACHECDFEWDHELIKRDIHLANAVLRSDPIIWVWTKRFGAQPWAGNGDMDVEALAAALQRIQDGAQPGWRSDIIYFLAHSEPGELEDIDATVPD